MEEDDTKPVGLLTAGRPTTVEDIKGWLRAKPEDVAEGSEEFDALVVMLTALLITDSDEAAEEQIAMLTGVSPERVSEFAGRLREASIWADGGTDAETVNAWMDEEHGWLALFLDALVAVGRLRRDGATYKPVPPPPPVKPVSFRRASIPSAVMRKLICEAIPRVGTEFTAACILAAIQEVPGNEQLERYHVWRGLTAMTKEGLLSVRHRGRAGNLYRLLLGPPRIAS
jgi:hypothetical protein